MLRRRLQVLVDEDRWARLEHEARRRRVSVGTVVREAIDERLPGDAEQRRIALQGVLDADPMEVPSRDDLRRELRDARSRSSG
ncbi:MAG: ribbon-helix-helix protein, CopG family [Acidimicrobiales bacterium]